MMNSQLSACAPNLKSSFSRPYHAHNPSKNGLGHGGEQDTAMSEVAEQLQAMLDKMRVPAGQQDLGALKTAESQMQQQLDALTRAITAERHDNKMHNQKVMSLLVHIARNMQQTANMVLSRHDGHAALMKEVEALFVSKLEAVVADARQPSFYKAPERQSYSMSSSSANSANSVKTPVGCRDGQLDSLEQQMNAIVDQLNKRWSQVSSGESAMDSAFPARATKVNSAQPTKHHHRKPNDWQEALSSLFDRSLPNNHWQYDGDHWQYEGQ